MFISVIYRIYSLHDHADITFSIDMSFIKDKHGHKIVNIHGKRRHRTWIYILPNISMNLGAVL